MAEQAQNFHTAGGAGAWPLPTLWVPREPWSLPEHVLWILEKASG